MSDWLRLPEAHFDAICCRQQGSLPEVLAALAGARWCAVLAGEPGARARALCGARMLGVGAQGRVEVAEVRAWCEAARSGSVDAAASGDVAGGLRVVDNSEAGPWMCRPLAMGADVVVERLGSWLGTEGVAVCARTERAGETFVRACDAPQADTMGTGSFVPSREEHSGDGVICAPQSTNDPVPFVSRVALRTASLRMQRRCDTALVLASYLVAHPAVAWVSYPGLADDPAHDAAHRTLEHGAGPLVSFGLAEERDVTEALARAEAQPCLAASAAGEALACDLTRLERAGSRGDALLVRAGLETPLDVIAALEACLA